MENEEDDIIIILSEDDDDLRNATVIPSRRGRTSSSSGRRRLGGRPMVVRQASTPSHHGKSRKPRQAGPIVREETGGLSIGTLVDAGAQVLAAIQSLPAAPVATGEVEVDVANLMTYQQAIAEHAKADERLRTVGSLAAKLFA